jgi:hypothetical protein
MDIHLKDLLCMGLQDFLLLCIHQLHHLLRDLLHRLHHLLQLRETLYYLLDLLFHFHSIDRDWETEK